ncbi:uncharacterized protein LOC142230894 [Haematobia irritans]|uniref:uncharacterized protein LOC142230894 n=1 Tax=Haematobia irritans TaxID=7368 RepID=UPI003F4F959F
MQQLWLEGVDWDEDISPGSNSMWKTLCTELPAIHDITIPRWIRYSPGDIIDIHGFCDASKSAYCACIYIRVENKYSNTFCNLLTAKSKVAPLKTVTLPKLELNGALLLAKLVNYVSQIFDNGINSITLWTDASIVLGWLSKPPMTWETYVANRTLQIHDLVTNGKWRYVPTQDNPADLGTRGCSPQDLISNTLWWNGPKWLTMSECNWPKKTNFEVPIRNNSIQICYALSSEDDILSRFSSYTKALRVISYVFRFFHLSCPRFKSTVRYSCIELTLNELQFVKTRLIVLSQRKFYPEDYEAVMKSEPLSRRSSLSTLNPFLDSEKVLRVNGRLSDSSLPYRERYPIILPGNSKLCRLYLLHLHIFLAHAETTQMCRFSQTEFYISRLRPRVKGIIHRCKVCIIHKHKPQSQIIAPLPPERCTLSPPFHITGVDFAGPFDLKSSILRNSPNIKGYKFIPPHAPHMGGLWEAAVKSFKTHFKKLAGSHKFTFEQFSTILARIEGVLNSRPISAISEDPTDLTALTPGHFLRGAPLMALPESLSPNLSLVNRWLKLKALHHQFSVRWKQDYLKALQKRYKWRNAFPNLKPGDLVVIIDDLLPPNEWRLGRIERTYEGSDNNVRVADIKTATELQQGQAYTNAKCAIDSMH